MALITIQVDHYHHIPQPPEIPASIEERLDRIMTKLSELPGIVSSLTAQVNKTNAEVLARIDALEASLQDVDLPQATLDEIAGLRAAVQAGDDIVPDA